MIVYICCSCMYMYSLFYLRSCSPLSSSFRLVLPESSLELQCKELAHKVLTEYTRELMITHSLQIQTSLCMQHTRMQYMYTHAYIHVHTCIYACVYIHVHTCIYTYAYTITYSQATHTLCMYIYTHTSEYVLHTYIHI